MSEKLSERVRRGDLPFKPNTYPQVLDNHALADEIADLERRLAEAVNEIDLPKGKHIGGFTMKTGTPKTAPDYEHSEAFLREKEQP